MELQLEKRKTYIENFYISFVFCELGLRMLASRILLDFQVETIFLDDSIGFKERHRIGSTGVFLLICK